MPYPTNEIVQVRRVFLDTQIWVHFANPKNLGLPALVGADQVIVVVPEITVRELDKLKSTSMNRKVKDRAVHALRAIQAAQEFGEPLEGNIKIEIVLAAPRAQLEADELDQGWADDVLVASVLACRDAHPDEPTPALVSDDTGPSMKCWHFNLICVKPDQLHRLRNDDEKERENNRLRREVQMLRDAQPQLKLVFVNGFGDGRNIRFSVRPEQPLDEVAIQDGIDVRYPDMIDSSSAIAGFHINPARINRYNEKLKQFRSQRFTYEKNLHQIEDIRRCSVHIVLEVRNTGTAPAEDVRLILRFPENSKVWLANDPPPELDLKPPREPERPHPSGLTGPSFGMPPYIPHRFQTPIPVLAEPSFRVDESESSCQVVGGFKRVMHGVPESLPELVALSRGLASFAVCFELHTANRPEPMSGTLNVKIVESTIDTGEI